MIVWDLGNRDETVGGLGTSQEVSGWSVKTLADKTRKEACKEWHQMAAERPRVGEGIKRQNIEEEAEWIEPTLMRILDRHTTQIRVTA